MTAAVPNQMAIKGKAWAWTLGLHLLLLLLFFWLTYTVPVVPADSGMAMEVNLGSSNDGSGTDQPMQPGDPANYAAAVRLPTAPDQPLPENVFKSDDPNATALNPAKNTQPSPPSPATATSPQPPAPQPKYLYNGNGNGVGGNGATQTQAGTSEGNGTGNGDKGVVNGTPGASEYSGGPGTGGIGHTLTGRKITPDRFEAAFNEGGVVVIHVTVDRDGNIVNKYVKSSPNAQLTKLALEKLSHAKFSKSTGSEPQQFGDVTIVFKARG